MQRDRHGQRQSQAERSGFGSVSCGQMHIKPSGVSQQSIGPFPVTSIIVAGAAAGALHLSRQD